MKLTLLQKQALRTAFIGTLIFAIISFALFSIFEFNLLNVTVFCFLYFLILFLVFHFQMRNFILVQLDKVYKADLFDKKPLLNEDHSDLDFEKFIEQIKQFAENKHEEIQQLHNRDDFRRDFLGDVSHELKTPLFTAQGYLLTVLDDGFEDPVLRKKYLERTNKSLERLTYIVKDLDMIAKLESGMKLERSNFNLVRIVKEVFDLLEIKANKKNISLAFQETYDFPILVNADKEKIEQVLINLISNSIKYGNLNGTTLVNIKSHTNQDLLVEVIDNGVGIDEKNLSRLFERFYRVDKSRSRDQGGSGLGLAIVKHIVEAHGQEVFVTSEIGEGSTFAFTLSKVI